MKRLLEAHILQNFSPSSLNLDESGGLKDCVFGGVKRARVSSQCWKRAMRAYVKEHELLPPERLAWRSREFPKAIMERLAYAGKEPEAARTVVTRVFAALDMPVEDDQLGFLVFLAASELEALTEIIEQNWDSLNSETAPRGRGRGASNLPEGVASRLGSILFQHGKGGDAVDLALFGRMLAVAPARGQETACQVAHAIGTHALTRELDYFTALDDLLIDRGERFTAHLGSQEFGSSCFYRYLALDLELLAKNLRGDQELVRAGLSAFVRAAILAAPTGKQNSFAAHNPPGLVVLRRGRDTRPFNLANAFERPVRPEAEVSLTLASQRALSRSMIGLDSFLGSRQETVYWSAEEEDFKPGKRVATLTKLLGFVERES